MSGMTTDQPDEPPSWLHDRIMAALAPRLAELRQEAAGSPNLLKPLTPRDTAHNLNDMTPDAVETVSVTTPRGSTVTFPFLTPGQREQTVVDLTPIGDSPPIAPPGPVTAGACGNCHGAGGWNEQRKQKTGSGGEVVINVWVNCRPCGGTGKK
jgi:hypothetical protein